MTTLGEKLLANRDGYEREQERRAAEEQARRDRERRDTIDKVINHLNSAQAELKGKIEAGYHDPEFRLNDSVHRLLHEHSTTYSTFVFRDLRREQYPEIEAAWVEFLAWFEGEGLVARVEHRHDGVGMSSWEVIVLDVLS